MAKFCQYCGKPLDEGVACNCEESVAAQSAASDSSSNSAAPTQGGGIGDKLKIAFHNLIPFVKSYCKSPVDSTRSALENNDLPLASLFVAIQAILSGLMVFFAVKGLLGPMGGYVKVPFFSLFFYGLLAVVLSFFTAALAIFLIGKVMKVSVSFTSAVIACGVGAILPTVCAVVLTLCSFLSVQLAAALLTISLYVSITTRMIAAKGVLGADQSGKFYFSFIIGLGVADLATSLIITKLLSGLLSDFALGALGGMGGLF